MSVCRRMNVHATVFSAEIPWTYSHSTRMPITRGRGFGPSPACHNRPEASTMSHPTTRLSIELPREPSAPLAARTAFDRLETALPRERFEDARLLLSELVTNAVKYGGDGPLRVDVREADGA